MPDTADLTNDALLTLTPYKKVSVREVFGVDSDMMVPAFSTRDPHVPDLDEAYQFDPETTESPSAVTIQNRRLGCSTGACADTIRVPATSPTASGEDSLTRGRCPRRGPRPGNRRRRS